MGRSELRKQEKIKKKRQRILGQESPTMTFVFQPEFLMNVGPIISTHLSITESHAKYLKENNLPIPSPVRCRFLIDTGAGRSMVKHSFAEQAGLKLINEHTPIHGVGVDTTGKTYMGRILFITKSQKIENAKHTVWVDAQIASGTLNDIDVLDGLIGRDILQYFDLKFNGRTGAVTLKYIKRK